ncbi:hypothetical protein HF846_16535 [Clostridium cadaveris]|uniref:hypothetical protein n=3 Tax=Clostridium cadaveris TaxID=1529 RepID=UPI00145946A4|nr:hypothetical protein [Clostridium cadaveris]NME66187.1 hypothetical protein [Clostridium cadaveris]
MYYYIIFFTIPNFSNKINMRKDINIIVFVLATPCNFITDKIVEILVNLGQIGGSMMGAAIGLLGGLDYGGMISKVQSTFSTIAISENISIRNDIKILEKDLYKMGLKLVKKTGIGRTIECEDE